MASSVQPETVGTLPPSADVVGNAFAHQYYHILHQSPEHVHRFYLNDSKLGRPGADGVMNITTTAEAINEKILSLNCGEFRAEIITVDAQESLNGGVLVLVTGYLTGKDNLGRKFTQSFFLAPQEKGYFVLNDVFRYVEDTIHQNGNQAVVSGASDPVNPENDAPAVQENHVPEQSADELADDIGEVVNNSDDDVKVPVQVEVQEEEQVREIVDEVPDDGQVMVESNARIEDTPKKSYASILKVMKESVPSLSSSPAAPPKSAARSQEQVAAAPPPPAPVVENHVSVTDISENGNMQEAEGDGHSIYVKGLPMNATPALLANEFKKFGPIKIGGIQVRSQKGFCFGFVEFEAASAVQSALEASPIMINGRQVAVEEKRSTSRVNNRGRFTPGGGRGTGYRNDGGRGRGNYGNGRNYGRNDFNNRAEYGNNNRAEFGNNNRFEYGNNNRAEFGNNHRAEYGNNHRAEYGNNHRAEYGNNHRAEYGNNHRAEYGNNNRAEYGNKNGNRGGFSNRGGDGHQRGEQMGGYGGRGNRTPSELPDNAAAKASTPQVSARA